MPNEDVNGGYSYISDFSYGYYRIWVCNNGYWVIGKFVTPKEKCNGFGFSGAARYLKANYNTKNGPHEGCVHEVGHDWLYNDERGKININIIIVFTNFILPSPKLL